MASLLPNVLTGTAIYKLNAPLPKIMLTPYPLQEQPHVQVVNICTDLVPLAEDIASLLLTHVNYSPILCRIHNMLGVSVD
jgi:hypothetical protein